MAVNAAVIRQAWSASRSGIHRTDAAIAVLGFCFCLAIWVSLPMPAKVAGGLWLAAGIVTPPFERGAFAPLRRCST